ncbi:LPXTG cell wall anchor domain-containing protein [Listeria welshimeri]|uniref:LPXTG cell wall anchor domain-containing protein n=1 Tax=Listeria welshimeri TaxID=1643 RepID=UPI00227205E7|nr:LPXTG cell wall anchor domain-containing protein [Listeria welshimeri]
MKKVKSLLICMTSITGISLMMFSGLVSAEEVKENLPVGYENTPDPIPPDDYIEPTPPVEAVDPSEVPILDDLDDQIPDEPDVPDVPDVPDLPDIPDVPNVPDVPDVPDVPGLPDTVDPINPTVPTDPIEIPDVSNDPIVPAKPDPIDPAYPMAPENLNLPDFLNDDPMVLTEPAVSINPTEEIKPVNSKVQTDLTKATKQVNKTSENYANSVLPKTGDTLSTWPIIGLFIFGAIFYQTKKIRNRNTMR